MIFVVIFIIGMLLGFAHKSECYLPIILFAGKTAKTATKIIWEYCDEEGWKRLSDDIIQDIEKAGDNSEDVCP